MDETTFNFDSINALSSVNEPIYGLAGNCENEEAFISPPWPGGDVYEMQNILGGGGIPSTSESDVLTSDTFGGAQSAIVQKTNESATPHPQLTQQPEPHEINSLSNEANISSLGNSGDASECDAAQKSWQIEQVLAELQANNGILPVTLQDSQLKIGSWIIQTQGLANEQEEIQQPENNGDNQLQKEALGGWSNGGSMDVEESPSVEVPEYTVLSKNITNQNWEIAQAKAFPSTILLNLFKANQDNTTEPSHSSGSELDQIIKEVVLPDRVEAIENSGQTYSLPATTGLEPTRTKPPAKRKRGEKTVKMHERKDSDNPEVARAKKAKGYRERKKQAEEKLKAEHSSLQEKYQHLSDEVENCNTRINAQDETIKKLESEKQQLAAQNKELRRKSKNIPTPIETVKMIEHFRDVVSKLPNNCPVVIAPQLAEMRVPQLSVGYSDQVRLEVEQNDTQPERPELSLKVAAFFDLSGVNGVH